MEKLGFVLAIHRGLNLTHARYEKLKLFFDGDWEKAFSAPLSDWHKAGIDPKGIEKFFSTSPKLDPQKELDLVQKCGATVLLYDDENYPLPLKNISQPPALLLVRGKIVWDDFPCLAVVGSRKISAYGRQVLGHLLTPITESGTTIVSGLALGTDSEGHRFALGKGVRTLAVLGNGIDHIYPAANRALGEKIINQGAIISEYLPGIEAIPEYFPHRNRIVAGLSKGTLVIEGAKKSGSLITAHLANDFGREVFAVPGSLFSTTSGGTNELIEQGVAHPALSGEQILELCGIEKTPMTQKVEPTELELKILNCFATPDPIHIDDLVRNSEFSLPVFSSHLMLLEVKGWIRNLGGQMYVKNV